MLIPRFIATLAASLLFLSCQSLTTNDDAGQSSGHGGDVISIPEHGIHYLEFVTPDADVMRDFYSQAYGLEFSAATPELGNAYFANLPGESLLGIRAPMHDMEKTVVRTYLRVSDIHAATKRAEELGATIAVGAMEIPGRGQISVYMLGGIEHGIWQLP